MFLRFLKQAYLVRSLQHGKYRLQYRRILTREQESHCIYAIKIPLTKNHFLQYEVRPTATWAVGLRAIALMSKSAGLSHPATAANMQV
jgi:hypothetical protein